MALLNEPYIDRRPFHVALIALGVAVLALVIATTIALRGGGKGSVAPSASRFDRIVKSGTMRVGFGGYPPYTLYDSRESDPARRVQGFSVDLVEEIAKRSSPPLRVEWHQFSWDTLKADIDADRFDFVAEPVFETIPRARDFAFGEPYSYFGIAAAVVRIGETRFQNFEDLDRAGITIALAEGYTSSEYARQHLSKPTFKSIPVSGDAFNQLDEVTLGRADAALNDVPTVVQYVRAHKDRVKALWVDKPPSTVPGAFLLRKEDVALKAFLNSAIRIVVADKTLDRIDGKWRTFGFFPQLTLQPGRGLTPAP